MIFIQSRSTLLFSSNIDLDSIPVQSYHRPIAWITLLPSPEIILKRSKVQRRFLAMLRWIVIGILKQLLISHLRMTVPEVYLFFGYSDIWSRSSSSYNIFYHFRPLCGCVRSVGAHQRTCKKRIDHFPVFFLSLSLAGGG